MKENPNALKHLIDLQLVNHFEKTLVLALPNIKLSSEWKKIPKELASFELKMRVKVIGENLFKMVNDLKSVKFHEKFLNEILTLESSEKISGLQWWPISIYLEELSYSEPKFAFRFMQKLTTVFTSEFAIRPLLNSDPEFVLHELCKLSLHKNVHLRRWSSEGTRPLLPWGLKASAIEKNPSWTKQILENLKYDDELYVRKSVANHLNDFSKKNPDYVIQLLRSWNKEASGKDLIKIQWISKMALRTLIKKGDKRAIEIVNGKVCTNFSITLLKLNKKKFKLHDELILSFNLLNSSKKSESFVIDYKIGYCGKKFLQTKNKSQYSFKTYKGKLQIIAVKDDKSISLKHKIKPITTKQFYSGIHQIQLLVNGVEQKALEFHLEVEQS